ncbi:MAG: hypothetical protein IIC71_08540 [Acidobacteria bacterium]|nr:hypothetical protein [Acidobacteriota bacterium]
MYESLVLARLKFQLVAPMVTGNGVVKGRDIVLVGVERDNTIGWGEAAPFPGYSQETVDDVWLALGKNADLILKGSLPEMPATAKAALDQARWDLAARLANEPLWSAIGGLAKPIACRVAVSGKTIPDLLAQVQHAVDNDIPAVKVKVMPGRDVAFVEAVVAKFPELSVAVDANESFDHTAQDVFNGFEALNLDFIEQPLHRDDLRGHARLAARIDTPIALDESLHSDGMLRKAIDMAAADLLTVKPGIIGISGVLEAKRLVDNTHMKIRLSGLVESSVGRASTIALATLDGMGPSDLAPTSFYLRGDSCAPPWDSENGSIDPRPDPGIGVVVDIAELEDVAVAWGRFTKL